MSQPATQSRRRNKRSETTIQAILDAAEEIIVVSGVDRISILDVCRVAGISRGTFYRYFSSQDELLDAFSRFKRERFHSALTEALAPYSDPDERFAALVNYLDEYLEVGQARKILIVAPKYALGWFRRIFQDSIVKFQEDLSIVFDAWDQRLAVTLDREMVCELLVRYILSEQLVKGTSERRRTLPGKIKALVNDLMSATRGA
ncbi:TetR/AcrR family transcriptional regulator [Gammaproteobacteria bacterium LSUCC0057]|jgi:AcrR family transcriptional regulator|uniref:TetR/AcrR family transcriptional regulator n=1 Tax=Gammaproteobacteria bacterium LSUCC0057 TaxID=2559237 RepID=A0A4Y8UHA9_9GAMM|nr:TetR/AcrR family transcriptional regulator [Gammaproteobacteria bacterium LSUCC0057]